MAARPLVRWMKCDGRVCAGYRQHEIVVTTQPDGRVTREAVCSACSEVKPFGLCCPACGDARFFTIYTRHRAGATVRRKRCRGCGHKVRTKEVIESANT